MYFGYGLVGLIELVLVVWAIVDLLSSRRFTPTTLIWLLIILVLPVLGAILYFLIGRGRASLA
jgi:hypothetical protein